MLATIINRHIQIPRRARLVVPNIPLHIIQRGNYRQACFYSEDDYLFYLDWLLEYSQKTDCLVLVYVLTQVSEFKNQPIFQLRRIGLGFQL